MSLEEAVVFSSSERILLISGVISMLLQGLRQEGSST